MAFEVVWHPLASADLEDEIDYVLYEFGWAASKKLYAVCEKQITILVLWNNHRDPSYLEVLIGSR